MSSPRNIAFLALTAGLGIAAFLAVRSPLLGGDEVFADKGLVRGVTTAESGGPYANGGPGEVQGATDRESGLVDVEGAGAGTAAGDSSGETTVIWPLEVEVFQALGVPLAIKDGTPAIRTGATARIQGTVLGPSGRPAGATIEFPYGPNEGRVLKTDGRGRYGANDLLPGAAIVRITLAGGRSVEREVRLWKQQMAEFSMSFANASIVSGTVQDQRGAPVDGAEVQLDGNLYFTAQDGTFTAPNVPPGTILVTVKKDGFARTKASASLGLRTKIAPETFLITLAPGASLRLETRRTAGAMESSFAVIMPPSDGGRDFPWFLLNPITIPESGGITVEGLPAETVNVRVFHRGAVPKPRSQNVRLQAARENALIVELGAAPTVRGVVTDEGEPVAGAAVEIEAADQSNAMAKAFQYQNPMRLLDAVVPMVPAAADKTFTDSKGRFSFTSYPELMSAYYVTAKKRGRQGVSVVGSDEDSLVVKLGEVPKAAGSIEIDLPGRFQGLPVDVKFNGAPRDTMLLRPGLPLVIDELSPGLWSVSARWRGTDVIVRQSVRVDGEAVPLGAELPEGAIVGQPEDVRARAIRSGEGVQPGSLR